MTGRAISGAAVVAGVTGRPIAQSLSPLLHNAWIAAAGLDAAYVPFAPQDEAGFDTLIAAGRAGLIRGLNVTAPFKARALACADDVLPTARACGSANLLVFEDGRITADSTDGEGLVLALAEQAPALTLDGATAVVLGAGGAARAAVVALSQAGAEVWIINRTEATALAMAEDLSTPDRPVRIGDAALGQADLVVNALSVPPTIALDGLKAGAVLMDMTYRPLETAFLAAGRARGLTGVDGLAMLIGQARPSFRALFGVDVPDIDVWSRALTFLEDRG